MIDKKVLDDHNLTEEEYRQIVRLPLTTARPPCSVIRMSPLTCCCESAMKASSESFSGENQRPS